MDSLLMLSVQHYTSHNCCVGTFIPFLLLFGLSVNHSDYHDLLFHFVTY